MNLTDTNGSTSSIEAFDDVLEEFEKIEELVEFEEFAMEEFPMIPGLGFRVQGLGFGFRV